jgi:ribonuclease HI
MRKAGGSIGWIDSFIHPFIVCFTPSLSLFLSMSQFYAVRVGRSPGLYHSWNECQAQVSGYPGCKFQKFKTLAEANEFLSRDGGTQGCIDGVARASVGSSTPFESKKRSLEHVIDLTESTSQSSKLNNVSSSSGKSSDPVNRALTPSHMPVTAVSSSSSSVTPSSSSGSLLAALRRPDLSSARPNMYTRLSSTVAAPATVTMVDDNGSSSSSNTGRSIGMKAYSNQKDLSNVKYSKDPAKYAWKSPFLLAEAHDHAIRIPVHNVIFTDGACPNNGRADSRAGYGVFWPQRADLTTYGRLPGDLQTNQRAELYAIQVAIETIIANNLEGPFEIRTDSLYSVQSLTDWCHKWVRTDWTYPVKNEDLVKGILDSADAFQRKSNTTTSSSSSSTGSDRRILLRHIRGHAGDVGNEQADRLAVLGARL